MEDNNNVTTETENRASVVDFVANDVVADDVPPDTKDEEASRGCLQLCRKTNKEKRPKASTREMFQMASYFELFLFFLGILGACVNGCGQPVMIIFFGDVIDGLGETEFSVDVIADICLKFVIVGAAQGVGAFFQMGCIKWYGELQRKKMRKLYFAALMHQDISWFDVRDPAALPMEFNDDINKFSEAFSDQLGNMVFALSGTVSCLIAAFVIGWQIALVICSTTPAIAVGVFFMMQSIDTMVNETQGWYSRAAVVVEECLGGMRTVVAFGRERFELNNYEVAVEAARKGGVKHALQLGTSSGWMLGVMMWTYALAFWYGAKLRYDGVMNPLTGEEWEAGDILSTFFTILTGSFFVGQIFPEISRYASARFSMARFSAVLTDHGVIQRSSKETGAAKLESIMSLELCDVHFSYPARPHVKVLKGLNVKIERGAKVAFVGESGSGKSTVVSLLERFYDPDQGQVLVNGIDMKRIPVQHLRQHIGYVGQEPVLFATSLRKNILQGTSDASEEDLREAIDLAQLSFVQELPDKLETFAGHGGCQFSGGQKQRVAIARALVHKPSVLFLDEATSALDHTSEKLIQATIDELGSKSKSGMTIVSIAHRLSTIRGCDVIHVLGNGIIIESGSHEELMREKGAYWALLSTQQNDEVQAAKEASTEDVRHMSNKTTSSDRAKDSKGHRTHSGDKGARDVENQDKEALKNYKLPMMRLMSYNRPEWIWFVPAILGAIVAGLCMPYLAVVLVDAMVVFFYTDFEKMMDEVRIACYQFIVLGAVNFVSTAITNWANGVLSEGMVKRLRVAILTNVLRQNIGFHDDPDNSPAMLGRALEFYANRVSVYCRAVGAALGALTSVFAGLGIAFFYCWQMSLVMLMAIPILVLANVIAMAIMFGSAKAEEPLLKNAEQVVSDAVQNARTVYASNAAQYLVELHDSLVEKAAPGRRTFTTCFLGGIAFGVSVAVPILVLACGFYVAGLFIESGIVDFEDVMKSFMGIFYASFGAGQAALGLGDLAKGKAACKVMFELIDKKSMIDGLDPIGETPDETTNPGEIEFQNIQFRYPFRPDVLVLSNISFAVSPGQSIGLVGPSGGGKSTVMALLQRFYDPATGSVNVGSSKKVLSALNIRWWRQHIGFVGQEPLLFNRTVLENVSYGLLEGVELTEKRLEEVLLLDEATSALDSQSERVVQVAIDNLKQGRTSFSIAHRLSTIEDCDVIMVVGQGVIMERGTHDELMKQHKVYYKLQQQAHK